MQDTDVNQRRRRRDRRIQLSDDETEAGVHEQLDDSDLWLLWYTSKFRAEGGQLEDEIAAIVRESNTRNEVCIPDVTLSLRRCCQWYPVFLARSPTLYLPVSGTWVLCCYL